MRDLTEAATIKAQLQGLLKVADALLANKNLSKAVREEIVAMRAKLRQRWEDLVGEPEAGDGKEKEGKAEKAVAADEARRAFLAEAEKIVNTANSYGQRETLVRDALDKKYPPPAGKEWRTPWIRELLTDSVIYEVPAEVGRSMFLAAYSIDNTGAQPAVSFGEPKPVKMVYVTDEEAVAESEGAAFSAEELTVLQEPYPNEHAARLRNPGDFEAASFRSKEIAKGVRLVLGRLKGETTLTTQAYRFAVETFTEAEAKKWLKDHDVKYKTFEAAAGVKESAELSGEFIPLLEKAVRADGTVPIKIIEPRWGSSGYYPKEVLERDGPKVITKGTKMFWDHPTATEEAERPERSLRDLAGEFVTDARYEEKGVAGPGLYADAKVFSAYKPIVEELASHIGVSLRGLGKATMGEAQGKKGLIVERIAAVKSVDYVTKPGAGGQIVQLFEAARERVEMGLSTVTLEDIKRSRPDLIEAMRAETKSAVYGDKDKLKEAAKVTEEEKAKLEEANKALLAENAGLKAKATEQKVRDFVTAELKSATVPDLTRTRLAESLVKAPVMKADEIDAEAFKTKIKEAVAAEVDYLAKATGSGKITGMGGKTEATPGVLKESFKKMYLAQGKSIEEADKLAALAAEGR